MYAHLLNWMIYTPEFQLVVVLVSSPLALLVALWGMTSKATLQLMKSNTRGGGYSVEPLAHAAKEGGGAINGVKPDADMRLWSCKQSPCARSALCEDVRVCTCSTN